MPEAVGYVRSDTRSREGDAIEEAFADEHNARVKAIERGWRYYAGDHDRPLKVQSDGYDDNVIVNHVEALADRVTAFVIGQGIRFDAGSDDAESEADEVIEALWEASRGEILKEGLVLGGAVEGHVAVRISPEQVEGAYPRLIRIKQTHFTAFWDAFDMSRVLWYRLQHEAGGRGKRIDYVKGRGDGAATDSGWDHDAEVWTEVVYQAREVGDVPGSSPRWTFVSAQEWPYAWAPIVDWQNLPNNNGYYGRDDLQGAIGLNDALNFILSNAQRIVKHHADPKTVGTGFTAQELVHTAVGGFYTVANPDAKIYNLEMESDGAMVRWLTELIQAGLWQSGGMIDQSSVKDMVGDLTNFGLRVLFANAIRRTEKKRLLYGEGFEKIIRQALELMGRSGSERIDTVWSDALPEDDRLVAETLLREMEAGIISKRTYRQIRGYDEEMELDRLEEETQTGDVGASILGLLTQNRGFNRGV